MSQETGTWLNTMVLIGCTDKRRNAWHLDPSKQGAEPNHYPGFIPVEDVRRRLFNWRAVEAVVTANAITPNGVISSDGPCWRCAGAKMLDKAICPACRGTGRNDGGFKAIVRDDNGFILGVPKQGWQPHQYDEWLLENVAHILDDDLGIASAALLSNYRVAFVQVEVPEHITTPSGVKFLPFLGATTSFDGSIATTYKRGVRNWVCDNTMRAGLGDAGEVFKVKHSKHSPLKLHDAREALAVVHTIADDFAAEVEALVDVKVSDGDWAKFMDSLIPLEKDGEPLTGVGLTKATNKRNALDNLWHNDVRVSPWKGTGWGVVQAVNTADQHVWHVKGDRDERNMLNAATGKFDALDVGTAETLAGVMASR